MIKIHYDYYRCVSKHSANGLDKDDDEENVHHTVACMLFTLDIYQTLEHFE